ncbi:protocatechuate 3,4-dioxygenase [Candidatus Neoehrlichia procyonis]|uniref:Dioxygenase family protein n=1 Tax=Candidatus Neoehrlichia procyonis str. RAC413 TaxID=1359163 RepID=A0A0F3NQE4_9RICK|nr:protocatechuate 3,4-dioxygenase [Candidatus Neoehrlichia lotoris]KJV69104.1 dioxygenase family protein [Candidatus Neoehrlichia lotoris str. RAC413]
MRYMFRILVIVFVIFAFEVNAIDPVIMNCVETPEIYNIQDKPKDFYMSNNLRRKVGSAVTAKGELIYIVGRVTDVNCIPVENVNVFMWQANTYGIYQNDFNGTEIHTDNKYDENFSGSGKATTDNLGNYSFITVMPGKYSNRVPHVNFMLQHPEFLEFYTEMFFSEYNNLVDPVLNRMVSPHLRKLLIAQYTVNDLGIKIYRFNITLGEQSTYKTNKYGK